MLETYITLYTDLIVRKKKEFDPFVTKYELGKINVIWRYGSNKT